jgi:CheY-like chemotaxis protein
MAEPLGFLSYTRKDDQFFGGYITAFRAALEAGVQVVTGDRSFRLFQDVEGIVIGEQWQKKLAEVIGRASFFLPMLTPLFLSSLEKVEERDRDPVAREIAKRQRYDWRENGWLPLEEPAARKAVLTLAQAIAAALERITAPPRRGLEAARGDDAAAGERIAAVGGAAKLERPGERKVLWVDDRPANNVFERAALESYGIRFTLVESTSEAQAILAPGRFDAVISDLGRPGDRRAGLILLEAVRRADNAVPYFLYTSVAAAARLGRVEGAQGVTADPDELVAMVVGAVR